MRYLDIFDDIVNILHNDYAGCLDKKGWDNPGPYRQSIIELEAVDKLDVFSFKGIIDDYLLDFKDGHMSFRIAANENQKVYDNGFNCRRFGDKLYVTHAGREAKLKKGFAIVALDDILIGEIAVKFKRHLQIVGSTAERERWLPVIMRHNTCIVEDHLGNRFELELGKYEKENYVPEYSIKQLDNGILLIKLTDFSDIDSINKLLENNGKALDECSGMIIDVRQNGGGSDSAFMKLLDYIFPRKVNIKEINTGDMQLNMTERNYKLRVELFKQYYAQLNDEAARKYIDAFITELNKHRNKGFVKVDFDDNIGESIIHGRIKPENIVVLIDVFCGSSGDAFVQLAKKSEKATLMGRASAGITDYSNLAIQQYGDSMQLWYPTSRIASIDEGKGLSGIGVVPDIYIPWTPEHIERDIDIERAVEFLLNR